MYLDGGDSLSLPVTATTPPHARTAAQVRLQLLNTKPRNRRVNSMTKGTGMAARAQEPRSWQSAGCPQRSGLPVFHREPHS
jgi:hypothetical protein